MNKPSIGHVSISSDSKPASLYSGSKPLSKSYLSVAQDFQDKAVYKKVNDHLTQGKEDKRQATYNPMGTKTIDLLKSEFQNVKKENENMEEMIEEIRRRNEEAEAARRRVQAEKDYVVWERDI